jgi:NAD(P)-dependent dehydrogenase (short-subunit alcohol dehydrogenase family)
VSAFKEQLLAGKTAFIAGGTSGINLGIARRFAELGARVAVAGRNPEKAANAAAQIGGGALGFSCDVRDFAATRAVLENAAKQLGPLDIVVSGAAGNFVAPVLGLSANGFRTVVDIDLNGTFNVFRGAHDLLRIPGASLIAISAGQAVNPMMRQAHVCAAKAGVNQLIRVLAMEWGPLGIRVNASPPLRKSSRPSTDAFLCAASAPSRKSPRARYSCAAIRRPTSRGPSSIAMAVRNWATHDNWGSLFLLQLRGPQHLQCRVQHHDQHQPAQPGKGQ